MEIKQIRDLTVISIDDKRYIGIACDSCGAIGNKEYDVVKTTPQIVALQTAKVVLAELLSMGFTPLVLSDGLAVEMNDTGKQLIEGFNTAIGMLKTCDVHLTGSTEENMKTVQTSLGVTAIGICDKDKLKYNKTNPGDMCILVGLPLIGYEVIKNPDKIMDVSDYEEYYLSSLIKEIVPIGSRGIDVELKELCQYNHVNFKYEDCTSVDISISAGPSSCCIITVESSNLDTVKSIIKKPMLLLGEFCV